MTSTNDGKDVKSNQTSGQKGKTYYIELYKSLDSNLNAEGSLSVRVGHLGAAWRRLHTLCLHSAPPTHHHLLTWIQRHTARTIFQSEWQSPTSRDEHANLAQAIADFLQECQAAATSRDAHPWEAQLVGRAEWFKAVLGNPWEHPVLKALLERKEQTDEQILGWLKDERGVVFAARLRQLALSKKCDELVLALLTPVMDRVRACKALVPDTEQTEEEKECGRARRWCQTRNRPRKKRVRRGDMVSIITDSYTKPTEIRGVHLYAYMRALVLALLTPVMDRVRACKPLVPDTEQTEEEKGKKKRYGVYNNGFLHKAY
ncbi:hypothetical protein O0L34_g13147 [Tuta absoluta]|nr:hypothetical protein O0L34_g13147 [Tuta absoluta]